MLSIRFIAAVDDPVIGFRGDRSILAEEAIALKTNERCTALSVTVAF
ncbi:MAG: hypothetical protein RMZ69_05490 [Nostoc sp. ChiQUE01a]|nr:hypothetical protein [Nostoc sp. ChiQUE01a]